jgi:hypothetical protein
MVYEMNRKIYTSPYSVDIIYDYATAKNSRVQSYRHKKNYEKSIVTYGKLEEKNYNTAYIFHIDNNNGNWDSMFIENNSIYSNFEEIRFFIRQTRKL